MDGAKGVQRLSFMCAARETQAFGTFDPYSIYY